MPRSKRCTTRRSITSGSRTSTWDCLQPDASAADAVVAAVAALYSRHGEVRGLVVGMEEVRNPYAAPQSLVEPPVDVRDQILASRGARLGASLVDGILYGACFLPGY